MATVTVGPDAVARYYKLSVSTTPVYIDSDFLMGPSGQQVTKAIGVVHGGSVCMGMRSIINPSTTVGIPLAVGDVIELVGHDNINRASFIQDSGAAEIFWFLTVARR